VPTGCRARRPARPAEWSTDPALAEYADGVHALLTDVLAAIRAGDDLLRIVGLPPEQYAAESARRVMPAWRRLAAWDPHYRSSDATPKLSVAVPDGLDVLCRSELQAVPVWGQTFWTAASAATALAMQLVDELPALTFDDSPPFNVAACRHRLEKLLQESAAVARLLWDRPSVEVAKVELAGLRAFVPAEQKTERTTPPATSGLSPGAVAGRLDVSPETVNVYAKACGLGTPARGGRNFMYSLEAVLKIIAHAETAAGADTRRKATAFRLHIESETRKKPGNPI
jgi:hypothetical protein